MDAYEKSTSLPTTDISVSSTDTSMPLPAMETDVEAHESIPSSNSVTDRADKGENSASTVPPMLSDEEDLEDKRGHVRSIPENASPPPVKFSIERVNSDDDADAVLDEEFLPKEAREFLLKLREEAVAAEAEAVAAEAKAAAAVAEATAAKAEAAAAKDEATSAEAEAAAAEAKATAAKAEAAAAEAEATSASNRAAAAEAKLAKLQAMLDLYKAIENPSELRLLQLNIDTDSIQMTRETLNAVADTVNTFTEEQPNATDKRRSIFGSNSLHFLWAKLFSLIQSELKSSSQLSSRRMVYGWELADDDIIDLSSNSVVDFALIPSHCTYLSWASYCGGFNVTGKHPGRVSGRHFTGYNRTDAETQAITHAARCARQRWVQNNKSGEVAAYSCIIGSRSMAVVRVRVSEDYQVMVDMTDYIPLPTETVDSSQPIDREYYQAVYILVHLLGSKEEDLTNLMTPCMKGADATSGCDVVSGFNDNNHAVDWHLGSFLGRGGYGTVYASLCVNNESVDPVSVSSDVTSFTASATSLAIGNVSASETVNVSGSVSEKSSSDVVIKLATDYLDAEVKALRALEKSPSADLFPRLVDCLYDTPRSGDGVTHGKTPSRRLLLALKLSPRGVALDRLMAATGACFDPEMAARVVRFVGPQVVMSLKAAHECGVCHRDIRKQNVIIVPPDDLFSELVAHWGDITDETPVLERILGRLEESRVVLIDWGSSSLTTPRSRKVDDLKMAVEFVINICA